MEEDQILAAEWSWLVKHELSAKLEAINRHMDECSKKFSVVSHGGLEPLRHILLNSPHQGDTLVCTAVVDGDKISKAELSLKLPGRGSKPLHTTIKEHTPWRLKQIQDSANYFQRVRDIYAELSSDTEQSQAGLRRTLERFSSALHQTEGVLILPPQTSAHHIFTNEQKFNLKPELPDDLAVHFHISSALLVLTVLAFSTRHSSEKTQDMDSSTWMGATFEHGSTVYEVTSQTRVQAQVPWLQAVLGLLREILELTQDLIDKIKVFDGVHI